YAVPPSTSRDQWVTSRTHTSSAEVARGDGAAADTGGAPVSLSAPGEPHPVTGRPASSTAASTADGAPAPGRAPPPRSMPGTLERPPRRGNGEAGRGSGGGPGRARVDGARGCGGGRARARGGAGSGRRAGVRGGSCAPHPRG